MFYRIRETLAYSKIGKMVAIIVREKKYPEERVHWVQQRFADWNFAPLKGTGWK